MVSQKVKFVFLIVLNLTLSNVYINADSGSVKVSINRSLNEILEVMEEKYKSITTAEMTVENKSMIESPKDHSWLPGERIAVKYRRDGDKIDVDWESYSMDESADKKVVTKSRSIWDGKQWLEYTALNNKEIWNRASVARNDFYLQNFLVSGPQGSVLDGRLCSDLKPIYTILRNSKNIKIYDKTEEIGNSPCYVIESNDENGNYKLWLDSKEYIIKKALVHKEGDNIFVDHPLSHFPELPPGVNIQRPVAIDFELNGIETSEVNGRMIASRGYAIVSMKFENGSSSTQKNEILRSDIKLDVDFANTDAFKMEMPIGTRVWDMETPHISYFWNGYGEPLTAWVDQEFIDVLDSEVEQVKSGQPVK